MALTVGVPKETKTAEHRVALTPDGVRELERHGVEVFVEAGAGVDSAVPDADFERAGATIVPTAQEAWSQEMVVKAKGPRRRASYFAPADAFTYLHLAYPDVAKAPLAAGTTGIAYGSSRGGRRAPPSPMSEVVGHGAADGRTTRERHNGGRG
jgi:alanine dehydrogenase